MQFVEYGSADYPRLKEMSIELFEDYDIKDLERDLQLAIRSKRHRIIIAKDGEQAVGFLSVSIRHDYVEGAKQSPTGYLEALYVESEYRKKGIAKELVSRGEQWVRTQGCTQIGSDTWLTNKNSQKFHKSIGYREEDVLVHFIKDLE